MLKSYGSNNSAWDHWSPVIQNADNLSRLECELIILGSFKVIQGPHLEDAMRNAHYSITAPQQILMIPHKFKHLAKRQVTNIAFNCVTLLVSYKN